MTKTDITDSNLQYRNVCYVLQRKGTAKKKDICKCMSK